MDTDNLQAETDPGDDRARRQDWRIWVLGVLLVLVLILAVGGVIYGWQANANSQLANLNLASAQSAEQDARNAEREAKNQLAMAEGAGRNALDQLAAAQSQAQTARNAQATAESAAQQSATAEALAVQEREAIQEQANLATSRLLARAALDTLPLDPQLSAHLALQAIEAGHTFEAENALHQVLPELRLLKSTWLTDIVPNVKNWNDANFSLARDGELLIAGTPDGIELVDLADGTHSMLGQAKDCDWVKASQDGRWLFAECSDGQQVWELETEKLLYKLSDFEAYTRGFSLLPVFSTYPLLFLGSNSNGEIHARDVISGKERFVIPDSYIFYRTSVATSPYERLLATINYEGMVTLLDVTAGQELTHFDSGNYSESIALSPDGKRLATFGSNQAIWKNTIRIWDLTSISSSPPLLREIVTEQWFRHPPIILFSPDGQRIAMGSTDGQVGVWEVGNSTGKLTLSGHTKESWPLAFSPDGKLLASASGDGKIRVWGLETGQVSWEVAGGGQVAGSRQVAFSPDGTRLVSTNGETTTIHVLPFDELTEQVRSRLIRPMIQEECQTYLHQETCPVGP